MRTIIVLGLWIVGTGWPVVLHAGITRTQAIPLRAGWNAVFLEVQPAASHPSEVFGATPVTVVASFIPGRLDARYLRNPGDAPWREEGWAVWYAPAEPEAFLSNLHDLQAPRALLIRATADFTWTVTGEVRASRIQWHPNTCTLTGLPVDPTAPPTFARFFEGSPAHARRRAYRLDEGAWKLVRDPDATRIVSGEAYWIETDGASDYQGPLRLDLPASGVLDFSRAGGVRRLDLLNAGTTTPAQIRAEVVTGAESLPLRWQPHRPAQRKATWAALPSALDLPPLTAGARATLRLEPDREAMKAETGTTLLRVTDGRGTLLWVPIQARRALSDLATAQP